MPNKGKFQNIILIEYYVNSQTADYSLVVLYLVNLNALTSAIKRMFWQNFPSLGHGSGSFIVWIYILHLS